MAIITVENTDIVKEVPDGTSLIEVCRDLEVPFGCCMGSCGVCYVKVLDGAENLSQNVDSDGGLRACITSIHSGTVRLQLS